MPEAQRASSGLVLQNLRRNIVGTTSFDAVFPGMRKAQDFVVYPLRSGEPAERLTTQSETRIGIIALADGTVTLSKPRAGGAYLHHLAGAAEVGKLSPEQFLLLKAQVLSSSSAHRTFSVLQTDNGGALAVFGPALPPDDVNATD